MTVQEHQGTGLEAHCTELKTMCSHGAAQDYTGLWVHAGPEQMKAMHFMALFLDFLLLY